MNAHSNDAAKQDTPAQQALRLSRSPDGRTMVERNGEWVAVRVSSCFPWSAPDTYLSLRDSENIELALIPSLDDMNDGDRAILTQALRDAAFAFQVTRVVLVKKEFEIRQWEVICVEGPRVFQTKVDDWPRPLPPHGLLITDVTGDVYVIPDWTALDKQSRRELAPFVE